MVGELEQPAVTDCGRTRRTERTVEGAQRPRRRRQRERPRPSRPSARATVLHALEQNVGVTPPSALGQIGSPQ